MLSTFSCLGRSSMLWVRMTKSSRAGSSLAVDGYTAIFCNTVVTSVPQNGILLAFNNVYQLYCFFPHLYPLSKPCRNEISIINLLANHGDTRQSAYQISNYIGHGWATIPVLLLSTSSWCLLLPRYMCWMLPAALTIPIVLQENSLKHQHLWGAKSAFDMLICN